MNSPPRQSPLHEVHVAAGARMVPFAGWEMPVQYEGIMPEHKAVREFLGVFDISHMGLLAVASSEPEVSTKWLDGLLTNNVASLEVGQGQYTMLLNETGGVIDDLIVYSKGCSEYYLVVNASKTAEDYQWMLDHQPESGIMFADVSGSYAGLAVQGPDTVAAFARLFGDDVTIPERFYMAEISTPHGDVLVCRTGYTGEDGFELFCKASDGPDWWQRCLDAGAKACGLGARDSLRLEKCYPLNGNDLSPERSPLEAGLGFAVDLHKDSFIGRDTLLRQKTKGLHRRLVAIKQTQKSPPPRPGYAVYAGDEQVGTLTSGGMSPSLGVGISLAYLSIDHAKVGTPLHLEIRGKRFAAEVVKKPFL
ncbi:glycine cleavage system aminomethyltransferase GcvT [Fuerstiella marisgermanici]|uniref:Aminomethyltransferase n=1 Tax=Fuerstiella marisgermanici TaxID=1891926 RepID=A0A1P8W954_9PLAN|nr:glycine cleavage system aminomethyltransferase GcvT [Fuerstiella marisgermanici]APZ90571.1 Aminomethyltransferase [Fuerstiella marisgermanici]